jgi:hypothetical protein
VHNPSVVGVEPAPLSKTDIQDMTLVGAKVVLTQLLSESPPLQGEELKEAWRTALSQEMDKGNLSTRKEEIDAYIGENLWPEELWETFIEVVQEEVEKKKASSAQAGPSNFKEPSSS